MEHSKEFVALVDAARARILEIDASELATRLAKAP